MRLPGKLLCLLLIFCQQASAQYYNLAFRNYGSNNGLSQSEVECVYFDSDRFLWIGTHYGLNRYDGRYFTPFYHNAQDPNSIGENVINAIGEDSHKNLWLAVYNSGLTRLDKGKMKFENYQPNENDSNSLMSKQVNCLLVDKDDKVWIGTDRGLSVFDNKTSRFTNYLRCPCHNSEFHVLSISKDRKGNLWLGTRDCGLFLFKPGKGLESISCSMKYPMSIQAIVEDGRMNRIWLGTKEGLFYFDLPVDGEVHTITQAYFFPQKISVRDVKVDDKYNLWIATEDEGLYIYYPATAYMEHLTENYRSVRGLLSVRVSCLYKDPNGGMWVGSENGLQSFHNTLQKFYVYPRLNSMSQNIDGGIIYGIYEENNEILNATSRGVLVYNRQKDSFVEVVHKLKNFDTVVIRYRNFTRMSENTWWISTDHGIFQLRREQGKYSLGRAPDLNRQFDHFNIRHFLDDQKGNIWFATVGSGLLRYNKSADSITYYKHDDNNSKSIVSNILNKLFLDRDGNILVATEQGLSMKDRDGPGFTNIIYRKDGRQPSLNANNVMDLYDDGKNLWLATFGGGLNCLSKKDSVIRYYTYQDSLSNDAIYALAVEEGKAIWLGTNKGLSRFDLVRKNFSNYYVEDGLPANEFNMFSSFTNKQGEIFMGTVYGVASFIPQIFEKNPAPLVYLAKIRLNNDGRPDSVINIVNKDRKIEVRYNENLQLEFSALDYNIQSTLYIRYRIPGIQDEWVTSPNNNIIQLINMEPGIHNLYVQVSGNGEDWSPEWRLEMESIPPYWKATWFKVLLGLAALALGFIIVGNYIQNRLQRQRTEFDRHRAIEQERSRISSELHDDLGGGLTAIRLMSEMMKIKTQEPSDKSVFGKISDSSNDLIQKMNEIVWALNSNHDNLQSLIAYSRQYAVAYLDDLGIQSQVSIPDAIPNINISGNNRRTIFLLVKEALNNIAKHAQASKVSININIDEKLKISVHDNGRGINLRQNNYGNGLVNMQKRVEGLKGSFELANHDGTNVIFTIPLNSISMRAAG